ncbi:hypothetical protein V6N11_029060 [Hibiscus sabdariffa]|uniref:Uncharacterized protein n=2 Tax=Hibiscus sabdariffa TaxID=183260 RepID=A0ABR2D9M5_9ROSI
MAEDQGEMDQKTKQSVVTENTRKERHLKVTKTSHTAIAKHAGENRRTERPIFFFNPLNSLHISSLHSLTTKFQLVPYLNQHLRSCVVGKVKKHKHQKEHG